MLVHLKDFDGKTACRISLKLVQGTNNTSEVTCIECKKTFAYTRKR